MPWHEYSAHAGSQPLPLAEVRLWFGRRSVRLIALVDSGADFSLIDLRYADELGLDRADAVIEESLGAGGVLFQTYRWPTAEVEMQFEEERLPFRGSFVAFPPGTVGQSLLGREDFFERFIIQFWDAAELMNIDLSPDLPRPSLSG